MRSWFKTCAHSRTASINYGVPQGSISGPVLFSVYINSFAVRITESLQIMYADDTVIYNPNPVALC